MQTIVALVDFSDVSSKVLEQAERFAKAFNAQVVLLHLNISGPVIMDVGVGPPALMPDVSEEFLKMEHKRLVGFQSTLAEHGINVTLRELRDGNVKDVLEEMLRLNADLVILGSHHHNALYNLFMGSFTNQVVKLTSCPVVVVPADKALQPIPAISS